MSALQPVAGAVSVDGGLSRNGHFTQFLAEVVPHDLFLPDETEQTAAGLARMAAEAAGLTLAEPRAGRHLTQEATHRAERTRRFAAAREAVEGYAQGALAD
jgi:glycerol kinase